MKKIWIFILSLLLVGCFSLAFAEVPIGTQGVNAMVVGGWLRLRSGPGHSFQTIASLPQGSVVKVVSTQGDWCSVVMSDGGTGYMSRYYLDITNAAISTPPAPSQSQNGGYNAFLYSNNGGNVRLRSGPSYSYGVIGSYAYGTPVYVISHGANWDYVQIGSQLGYVHSNLVRTSNVAPPQSLPGTVAYITSKNGLGVRLRSQPKYGSTILGLYSVGTEVKVMKKNVVKGWDYIEIGSRSGYMNNAFLTKNPVLQPQYPQGNIVRDFIISNINPAPNDTVTINTVVPSNANVGYRWTLNGKLIGNTNILVVPPNADGKTIIVEVYGTGNFVGTVSKSIYVSRKLNPSIPGGSTVPFNSLIDVNLNKLFANVGDTIAVMSTVPLNATATYAWELNGAVISYNNSLVVPKEARGKQITFKATGIENYSGTVVKTISIDANGASTPPAPALNYSLSFDSSNYSVGSFIAFSVEGNNPEIPVNIVSTQWYKNGNLVSDSAMYIVQPDDAGATIKLVVNIQDGLGNKKTLQAQTVIN